MKIGELATAAGTQSETIRYYERAGLLPVAARSDANYRIYDVAHIQRLAFIRHCRSLDMTLEEIRALLQFKDAPEENCEQVNELLDEHIGHVATRIRELKILEKDLKALRNQCSGGRSLPECGILNRLDEASRLPPKEKVDRDNSAHVGGVHQQVRNSGKGDFQGARRALKQSR